MDNAEFESRAFANPDDSDQDFLDAINDNPARQQLLDDIRSLEGRIGVAARSVSAPAGLKERILAAAAAEPDAGATDTGNVVALSRFLQPLRTLALVATLALAVGLTYSVFINPNNPSAEELAFGQRVVSHVYAELDEIDASQGTDVQQVNQVFRLVGGTMQDDRVVTLRVRFAKPCAILPPNQSAHLVMQGSRGEVNVIIINNSPVNHEFSFQDERFDTVVIPLGSGNLILVGEHDESLGDVSRMITDNMEWLI